ncbi:MAG: class I SAM-dependent methyltransferase [Moorea sp. SIOASIH]|nr:class I SAM-dependent methyltransferase [Moorena sp. SIOASIH]NEO89410.1 class I SAM-dependent methyltransferase [Moorena sp. SIO3G5]
MMKKHKIQFPPTNVRELGQDQVYFYLVNGESREKIRLHDYERIFEVPELYEQVVYERLKCQSPSIVVDILQSAVSQGDESLNELRVLDLGAGNGIVGEKLKQHGVSRLIGVDIIPEAQAATERDRPGIYDEFYVMDFCNLSDKDRDELNSWSPNCLVSVAALGFGDIPAKAFLEAFNVISENAWVAFNIKETFLDSSDDSGFSQLIRKLIFSEFLDLYHLKRYRHRFSLEGEKLYYFALGGKKNSDVPPSLIDSLEL